MTGFGKPAQRLSEPVMHKKILWDSWDVWDTYAIILLFFPLCLCSFAPLFLSYSFFSLRLGEKCLLKRAEGRQLPFMEFEYLSHIEVAPP